MLELSEMGYHDLAWDLILDRNFPSWMYMIDNGATTIWERWDGYVKGRGFQDPGMNSLNHWALGSVGEWMWRNIMGLNPDENHPGWKHFTVAPRPGGNLSWAKGEYLSVRGRIKSEWEIKNGRFMLDVMVPPNTSATIKLPRAREKKIRLNNNPVQPDAYTDGTAIFHLESGSYRFVSKQLN
jgi:alpha-L-rhamnosidase